jgi:hypothetical protein
LKSSGAFTGSGVNNAAMSDRDISAASAAKLSADVSRMAANGAMADG